MPHITLNPVKGRKRSGYDQNAKFACWPWRGSLDPAGYGQAWNRRTKKLDKAHRVVYEYRTGNLAPTRGSGFELHHKCANRWCVNPAHLEVVTVQQNRLLRTQVVTPIRCKPIQHGTLSGYTHRKCRCPLCKDAINLYYRTRRAKRRAAGIMHGDRTPTPR